MIFNINKKLAVKFFFFALLTGTIVKAQTKKMNVYLFPGQGSDERLFSKLSIDSSFTLKYIKYDIPSPGCTLKEYACSLIPQIDTTQPYCFIGVSMGGMICTELTEILDPRKVIIISSAKCQKELPWRYSFQKHFPIHRAIPKGLIKFGAIVLQPIVEPDRNKEKEIFKAMISSCNSLYLKRTINMIINWDRSSYSEKIIHIHGNNDHTLPVKNVKADYVIKTGSHMMTLTRAEEISKLIKILF